MRHQLSLGGYIKATATFIKNPLEAFRVYVTDELADSIAFFFAIFGSEEVMTAKTGSRQTIFYIRAGHILEKLHRGVFSSPLLWTSKEVEK